MKNVISIKVRILGSNLSLTREYPELPYKYVCFTSIKILRLLFLMRQLFKKCNNLGAVFG
jgi:hypothetical protein